jgi:hypothetical protein
VVIPNPHRISPQEGKVEKSSGSEWQAPASGLASFESEQAPWPPIGDYDSDLPCVLFEAKPSLEITSVSAGFTDLFGVNKIAAIHRPSFLHDRVAAEDRLMFHNKLSELETCGFVSFVHRFVVASGLPIWVAHSLRKVYRHGEPLVRGCLVPLRGTSRLLALDQEVVSRFIHKLGNHFQLLNLVVSSLKSSLPVSRESDVLTETLDKAIDLTRVLSECNQVQPWVSELPLLEVIQAAVGSRSSEFAGRGVRLQTRLAEIPDDVCILSSPYLLEVAFGHLLQNALEACGSHGTVEFGGRAELDGSEGVARLYIRDSGCGISANAQDHLILPFFTTKKGRDGLGLTVASRFVEMHGGALRIKSNQGQGSEVTILLPLKRGRDAVCA